MNDIGVFDWPSVDEGAYTPEGWNSKHPIFREIVSQYPDAVVIEVGTWHGASAISMAQAGASRVYCVDTWLGSLEFWTTHRGTPERNLHLVQGYPQVYYHFLRCAASAGVQDVVVPVPMPSAQAAKYLQWCAVRADIVYIDASHEYEDVKADIAAYLQLLRPGGKMFGDDYTAWPGVRDAVRELLPNAAVIDSNFWVYEKPL